MKNKVMEIKFMQKDDLEAVVQIERSVFPDPWSYSMFSEQLDLPQIYSLVIAKIENSVVGYSGFLRIRDEGHITNLAIKPEEQSQGIGKSLVYFMFLLAQKSVVKSISLEVRTTNIKAQKLYSMFGFKSVTMRKNYYGYEDDALIMAIEDIGEPDFQKRLDEIRESLSYRLEDYVNLAS